MNGTPALGPAGSELIKLLSAAKEEGIRSHAAIEERERDLGLLRHTLLERDDAIVSAQREVDEILQKTQTSAGCSRQVLEVLGTHESELRILEEEKARLSAEVGVLRMAHEQAQTEHVAQLTRRPAGSGALADVPAPVTTHGARRLAFRKRARDADTENARMACSITALEIEQQAAAASVAAAAAARAAATAAATAAAAAAE